MKLLIIIFTVAASMGAKLTGFGGIDGSISSEVIEPADQNPRASSDETSLDQGLLVSSEQDELIQSSESDQPYLFDQASPDYHADHFDEIVIGYENVAGPKQAQSKEPDLAPSAIDKDQAFSEIAADFKVNSSGMGLTPSSESDQINLVTNSDLTFVEISTPTETFQNSSELDQTFSISYANNSFPGDSTGSEETSTDVEMTPSTFPEILGSYEDVTSDLTQTKTIEFSQTSFASTNHSIAETENVPREVLSGPIAQPPIFPSTASFLLRSNQSFEPELTEKEPQSEAETETFNIDFEGSTNAKETLDECPEDQVRHTNGKCVTPEVTRNVFIISAPKLPTNFANLKEEIPRPKTEHNIIFIRTSGNGNKRDPIILLPPQRKNVIYVLNKESEVPGQRVIEVTTSPPAKPEVYYVDYADGDEPFLPHGIDLETALNSATEGQGVILDNVRYSGSNLLASNERTVLADNGNVSEFLDDKNARKTNRTIIALDSDFHTKGNFINKTEIGSIQSNKENDANVTNLGIFGQTESLLFVEKTETPAENEVPI